MAADNMSTVLFRFGNVRPPQSMDEATNNRRFAKLLTVSESDFLADLAGIRNESGIPVAEILTDLRTRCNVFVETAEYLLSVEAVKTVTTAVSLTRKVIQQYGSQLTLSQIPEEDSPLSAGVVKRLMENLVAGMIVGGQIEILLAIQESLQAHHIQANLGSIASNGVLQQYLFANIEVPREIFPLPYVVQAAPEEEAPITDTTDQTRFSELASAIESLNDYFAQKREYIFEDPLYEGNPDVVESSDWAEMPSEVTTTLGSSGIRTGQRVSYIMDKLGRLQNKVLGKLLNTLQDGQSKVLVIGGAVLYSNTQARAGAPVPPEGYQQPIYTGEYTGFYPPGYESDLKPLGIMDLLRVEQRLCSYVAGEVAHIENLMAGELKDRSTRHLTKTIDTTAVETERETTTLRDTQTTERFELNSRPLTTAPSKWLFYGCICDVAGPWSKRWNLRQAWESEAGMISG